MNKKLILIISVIVVFTTTFKGNAQVYKSRLAVKNGLPNILGISYERIIRKNKSIIFDLSGFILENELSYYDNASIYIGMKSYYSNKNRSEGFFTNVGLSYSYIYYEDRTEYSNSKDQFLVSSVNATGGYQAVWGRFVLSPEVGYGISFSRKYYRKNKEDAYIYPGLIVNLSLGVAF